MDRTPVGTRSLNETIDRNGLTTTPPEFVDVDDDDIDEDDDDIDDDDVALSS